MRILYNVNNLLAFLYPRERKKEKREKVRMRVKARNEILIGCSV
jgi:hypothetical protein